jgi:ADP-dependent NAD(P)H-hydrate dehydratase
MPISSGSVMVPASGDRPTPLTPRTLRRWPLPQPADDADKEGRGRVLVVAGAPELMGAAVLAATAALRAGAGKLRIATVRSVAPYVALAVPEARVYALPETREGGLEPNAAEQLAELANGCRATLIGPGLVDAPAVEALLVRLLPAIDGTTLVLDSEAMMAVGGCHALLHRLATPAILTPHAGEMAGLLGIDKAEVEADRLGTARRAAEHFRAVVALKGAETLVVDPAGGAWSNRSGNVGLATSGSGDTLSGIVAGLAARGAEPARAAAWGVHLHGAAGDRLAERVGPLGYLARELLAEIPALMAALSPAPEARRRRAGRARA